MPLASPGSPCVQCLGNGLSPFEPIVSLGILTEPLKTLIHRIKYEHRWRLAEQLANRLLARPEVIAVLETVELIIPVPLHPRRQRERGYNQAELIARQLCRGFRSIRDPSQLTVLNVARRIRPTQTQTSLQSRVQREQNVADAFELIHPAAINNRHIALLDDVLTTGSTLSSPPRSLQPAKPAGFPAIVLAIADPKGRAFEVI